MGGKGYHNNVKVYLDSKGRTIEYQTIYKDENRHIEFIKDITTPDHIKNPEFSNSPNMIYVLLGYKKDIKSVIFYNENHMQTKVIAMDHIHKPFGRPHVDIGFNDTKREHRGLTNEEKEYVKLIKKMFKEIKKGVLL